MTRALLSSVLSVYATREGYAFMFFDTKGCPADWKVRNVRGLFSERNGRVTEEIEQAIERYCPDIVLIEDTSVKGSRRSDRIRRLYRSIKHMAVNRAIDVHRISQVKVKMAFAPVGAKTKYEIAQAIAREMPEIAFRLPKKREIWQTEPTVMGLFAAVALGVTFNQAVKRFGASRLDR